MSVRDPVSIFDWGGSALELFLLSGQEKKGGLGNSRRMRILGGIAGPVVVRVTLRETECPTGIDTRPLLYEEWSLSTCRQYQGREGNLFH